MALKCKFRGRVSSADLLSGTDSCPVMQVVYDDPVHRHHRSVHDEFFDHDHHCHLVPIVIDRPRHLLLLSDLLHLSRPDMRQIGHSRRIH